MTFLVIFYVAAGLLLAGLSIPLILRRIPPNGLYGFRVRKTLENPEIWYTVNVFAGKRLLLVGLGTAVAAVVLYFWPGISVDAYALSILGVVGGLLLLALIQSFLYLRSLDS